MRSNTRQGIYIMRADTTYDYGSGAGYALGSVATVSTVDKKNGTQQFTTTTTNSFAWWDGAVQSSTSFAKTNQSTYTSTYATDGFGTATSVTIADGRLRTVTIVNDMSGQAIRRDEADNNYFAGDPHEAWYRFAGRQMGYVGNNGTLDTDYASSINTRTYSGSGGAFRHGFTSGAPEAQFAVGPGNINSYEQGSSAGSHIVRAGESLSSIAANLWGDASLWHKIAEANGMSTATALAEGQTLIVPAGSTPTATTPPPSVPTTPPKRWAAAA